MTQEGSVRIRVGNDGESDGNLIIPGLFLYILFLSRYQDVIVGWHLAFLFLVVLLHLKLQIMTRIVNSSVKQEGIVLI